MAVGFSDGDAGLAQFTDDRSRDPRVLELARRIRYVVDPGNPYPDNYTGHIRVRLRSGDVVEYRKPHLRGGKHEPLSDTELSNKFHSNIEHGGWPQDLGDQLLEFVQLLGDHDDLAGLNAFRF
jgi:2-methylcitrate dehydratase PrpD